MFCLFCYKKPAKKYDFENNEISSILVTHVSQMSILLLLISILSFFTFFTSFFIQFFFSLKNLYLHYSTCNFLFISSIFFQQLHNYSIIPYLFYNSIFARKAIFIQYHCVKSVQIWSYFWSVFSCIRTEYGDLLRKSPYSVRIQENTDQK